MKLKNKNKYEKKFRNFVFVSTTVADDEQNLV